ncbi:hypothetical protein HDV00_004087 [Rhizophlyctis rosea]|nr:hypothetical protein HDV00_004087 [Rhizophlyctis rosea]
MADHGSSSTNPYLAHLRDPPSDPAHTHPKPSGRHEISLNSAQPRRLGAAGAYFLPRTIPRAVKPAKPPPRPEPRPAESLGNYTSYYAKRLPSTSSHTPLDARLAHLNADYFTDKRVLDIGCNAGVVTIQIAMLFHPREIEGIDIDPSLIRKARSNLLQHASLMGKDLQEEEMRWVEKTLINTQESGVGRDNKEFTSSDNISIGGKRKLGHVTEEVDQPAENPKKRKRQKSQKKLASKMNAGHSSTDPDVEANDTIPNDTRTLDYFPVTAPLLFGHLPIVHQFNPQHQSHTPETRPVPHTVSFRTTDILSDPILSPTNLAPPSSSATPHEPYDTILALSVTKWIHLNHGDDGILAFFRILYKNLKPGGLLILEPQEWNTYHKRVKGDKMQKSYEGLKLRPEEFERILTEQVGFTEGRILGIGSGGASGKKPVKEVLADAEANKDSSGGMVGTSEEGSGVKEMEVDGADTGGAQKAQIEGNEKGAKHFRRPIWIFVK